MQGPVNNIVSVLPGGSNDAVNLAIGGYLSFDDIRMNTVRDIKFSVDTDLQGDFYGGLTHYTNANVVSNIDSMDLFVQNISLELNSKQSNTNGRIISGYTAVNLESASNKVPKNSVEGANTSIILGNSMNIFSIENTVQSFNETPIDIAPSIIGGIAETVIETGGIEMGGLAIADHIMGSDLDIVQNISNIESLQGLVISAQRNSIDLQHLSNIGELKGGVASLELATGDINVGTIRDLIATRPGRKMESITTAAIKMSDMSLLADHNVISLKDSTIRGVSLYGGSLLMNAILVMLVGELLAI